jgi:hypothetical protein
MHSWTSPTTKGRSAFESPNETVRSVFPSERQLRENKLLPTVKVVSSQLARQSSGPTNDPASTLMAHKPLTQSNARPITNFFISTAIPTRIVEAIRLDAHPPHIMPTPCVI